MATYGKYHSQDRVRDALVATVSDDYVWAIIDGARVSRLLVAARACELSTISLFHGPKAAEAWTVAPHLVRFDKREAFSSWWAAAWGSAAGVLLESQADAQSIEAHIRSLLHALTPEGRVSYFRVYDPRVLEGIIPCSTQDELDLLFGPIRTMHFENVTATHILSYTFSGPGKTVTQKVTQIQ